MQYAFVDGAFRTYPFIAGAYAFAAGAYAFAARHMLLRPGPTVPPQSDDRWAAQDRFPVFPREIRSSTGR